jgi:hypothetical protein
VFVLLVVGATTSLLVSMNRQGGADTGLVDGSGQEAAADPGAEASEPPAEESASAAEETPRESAEPSDGESEAERDEDGVEEVWGPLTRHEDPSGFSVDVPEGWNVEREGHMVYFRNPDGGYLLVDQTDDPNPDAGDDWREFEPVGSNNFSGYALIGIEDVEADWAEDYVSAADWEFTFGNGDRHAINRGFHTEDIGYALFLVADNDDPDQNRALLDHMSRSFEPADRDD